MEEEEKKNTAGNLLEIQAGSLERGGGENVQFQLRHCNRLGGGAHGESPGRRANSSFLCVCPAPMAQSRRGELLPPTQPARERHAACLCVHTHTPQQRPLSPPVPPAPTVRQGSGPSWGSPWSLGRNKEDPAKAGRGALTLRPSQARPTDRPTRLLKAASWGCWWGPLENRGGGFRRCFPDCGVSRSGEPKKRKTTKKKPHNKPQQQQQQVLGPPFITRMMMEVCWPSS